MRDCEGTEGHEDGEPGDGGHRRSGPDGVVRLLHATALAANSESSVEAAMQTCVDEVCGYCGWPVGHFYAVVATRPASWCLRRCGT